MPNDPSLVLPSWLVLPMEMNSQTKFLKTMKTVVCWAVSKWDLRLLVSEDTSKSIARVLLGEEFFRPDHDPVRVA